MFRNSVQHWLPVGTSLPAVVFLGGGERQRQVAVPEQFPARALLEVQAVRRPEHPRAELGDGVVAGGLLPVAALAGAGAVRPLAEVQGHAAHDELRRLGGEPRVPPPAEAALDVGVRSSPASARRTGRTSRCRTARSGTPAPGSSSAAATPPRTSRTRRCTSRPPCSCGTSR